MERLICYIIQYFYKSDYMCGKSVCHINEVQWKIQYLFNFAFLSLLNIMNIPAGHGVGIFLIFTIPMWENIFNQIRYEKVNKLN